MASYLTSHFKGEYRIIADYDQSTNDYPRNESGDIDPSFDDFYIPSKKKYISVRHGCRDNLSCFIESAKGGRNILRALYKQETGKDLPSLTGKKRDTEFDELIKEKIITELNLLDGEIYFVFKANKLNDYAKILELRTNLTSRSPFSVKNLPSSDYKIPKDAIEEYKNIVSKFKGETMDQARLIKTANTDFKKQILKKKYKNWNAEKKQLAMDFKQYIYYKHLWDEYLEFTRDKINKE